MFIPLVFSIGIFFYLFLHLLVSNWVSFDRLNLLPCIYYPLKPHILHTVHSLKQEHNPIHASEIHLKQEGFKVPLLYPITSPLKWGCVESSRYFTLRLPFPGFINKQA